MKQFIGTFVLLAALAVPVRADAPGGIAGHIVDAYGNPAAGVSVGFFRMPLHNSDIAVGTVKTGRDGFFSDIGLDTGRYMVLAMSPTMRVASACAQQDVFTGIVTRIRLQMHSGSGCKDARIHSAVVNGDITADMYIVR
jgi:5-hydroxyisourate hydrolase-like protein (transthyretin family)